MSALAPFHRSTRAWFEDALGPATDIQAQSFPIIAAGESVLISAPTGSGKTLAAFLGSLDAILHSDAPDGFGEVRVVYVSPLKALAADIDKNLRAPIAGILKAAALRGERVREPRVFVRTADTPAKERTQLLRHGADILITTPESLYLLLTSAARKTLAGVRTVILDEIHAVAGTKRGTHLFVSIERLEALRTTSAPLQRIGLSATQRPLELMARALGGYREKGVPRPVRIVEARHKRSLSLSIEMPSDDGGARALTPQPPLPQAGEGEQETPCDSLSRLRERGGVRARGTRPAQSVSEPQPTSSWPAIHKRLVELVRAHRSTMIFVNSRRLGERLASAINEVAGSEIALAHHGSVAHEKRREIEDRLKRGDLPAIVATSSLELGIDMGAVDLVVQIEAPPSVASGIQRVGRAGHRVGEISRGVVFSKFRGDLLACAATVRAMEDGLVERAEVPMLPLDVLAQQIVAIVATEPITVNALHELVARALPYGELSRQTLHDVLDMLSGLYPSDAFAGLRPRISWDRETGLLTARAGARSVAVMSGGTIADRGLYGVFVEGSNGKATRVGELDEEMVFETRLGDVFLLGASAWRVEEITRDRVLVSPAPGEPGRMPFWRGDRAGRPAELGARIGELSRTLADLPDAEAIALLRTRHHLDPRAAADLMAYVSEQHQATGEVPSDRTIVIERFRDEVGDVRVCILSPYGARVHAAWAMAVLAAARDRRGLELDVVTSDDGMVFRVPDVDQAPANDAFLPSADEVADLVRRGLDTTALFAGRFRENAARALLLPRGRPGQRTPLWSQRKKASELLAVASRFDSFPIVLETYRECLRDVLDLPSLIDLLRGIASRAVRVVAVETTVPSPFARSLLFSYVGAFMYEGDAPLAERRAQALRVDPGRLRELLGDAVLRDLLDPEAIAAVERAVSGLGEHRPHHADGLHDMLLSLGDLTTSEVVARVDAADPPALLRQLHAARRIAQTRIGDEERWFAVEDAGRLRDAFGIAVPRDVSDAFLVPVRDALGDVVSRYARTHGPFELSDIARRFGLPEAVLRAPVDRLVQTGKIVVGAFTPGRTGDLELCDADVLRRIKARSLTKLRREIEPVPPHVLAAFAVAHHRLHHPARGEGALVSALEDLEGVPLPISVLLGEVLPARVRGCSPFDVDNLAARGEVMWRGIEPLGSSDARVAIYFADRYALLAPPPGLASTDLERATLAVLETRGAIFFRDLERVVGGFSRDLERALWSLVWAGRVTNDTLAPLRSRLANKEKARTRPRTRAVRTPRAIGTEGRWSLLPSELAPATDRAAALAEKLLSRYGVLTREAVVSEGTVGGYGAVYPVLRAMEEAGKIRRGYFVATIAAMQFALPGSEDRLRSIRNAPVEGDRALLLASTDPANLYGGALPWPRAADASDARFERALGTYVVLRGGRLLAFVGRGGRALVLPETLGEADARSLAGILARRGDAAGSFFIERIDGEPARSSPLAPSLLAAGFVPSGPGALLYVPVKSTAQPIEAEG